MNLSDTDIIVNTIENSLVLPVVVSVVVVVGVVGRNNRQRVLT